MLRIRKVYDDHSPANRDVIAQVQEILRAQFPGARTQDSEKIPLQLRDPMHYRYQSVLLVAESALGKVKGFAMLLHMPDVQAAFLELISAGKGDTGGGLGGVLYEHVREEAAARGVLGLFFECSVDDPAVISDAAKLEQNRRRLKFYERFGARPIMTNAYATPVHPGDRDLYYLMLDALGRTQPLPRDNLRVIVRAILERKYADLIQPKAIEKVAVSFTDEFAQLRPQAYLRRPVQAPAASPPPVRGIALLVNESHDIHHVRDRGYVEAPVRIPIILRELEKTGLFKRLKPRRAPQSLILKVHTRPYLEYLHDACAKLPKGKSIYPIIFPVRNLERPPKDIELQIGYYCTDTFTPINANVYRAAHGAVDCALTAAEALFEGHEVAYALVRPPGHHAERRVFGGFCYLNNAAVAAEYLSQYGRVAILDLDFHHGNGQQDIFYERPDVFTVSIHGAPPAAYPHYSGFADECGSGAGTGANLNLPLPEKITPERYRQTLRKALAAVTGFAPAFLVICLGLDTAKADPTGTWPLLAADFAENGRLTGALGLPTLVVQEGGYRTRTLGVNARSFFEGFWQAHPASRKTEGADQPQDATRRVSRPA